MHRVPREIIEQFESMRQPLTLTDPALPDNPIVLANKAFLDLTGYRADEVIGRNCRFLQGAETDPAEVDLIREAIAGRQPVTAILANYNANGTQFWNLVSIDAVRNRAGRVLFFAGLQYNIDTVQADALTEVRRQSKISPHQDRLLTKSRETILVSIETMRRGIITRLMIALARAEESAPLSGSDQDLH